MASNFLQTYGSRVAQFVLLALAFALAPVALALTATADAPMRDPWVPLDTRKAAAATPSSAPTHGSDLQAQVARKLKLGFDAAVVNGDGTLTAAQARAAGLGFIAKHFDEMDQRKLGVIRFEDVTRFMNARGAALPDR